MFCRYNSITKQLTKMEKSISYIASDTDYPKMSISQLAAIIRKDWRSKGTIYFGAVPYLEAMHTMDKITDNYGLDSGRSIVLYFLANAQTWRGEVAKAVKLELNKRVKKS
jgi:hypothetical protein